MNGIYVRFHRFFSASRLQYPSGYVSSDAVPANVVSIRVPPIPSSKLPITPDMLNSTGPETEAFQSKLRKNVASVLDALSIHGFGALSEKCSEIANDAEVLEHELDCVTMFDNFHRYSFTKLAFPSFHAFLSGRAFYSTVEPQNVASLHDAFQRTPLFDSSRLPKKEYSVLEIDYETSPDRGYLYGPVAFRHVKGNRRSPSVESSVILDSVADVFQVESLITNDQAKAGFLLFLQRLLLQEPALLFLSEKGPWNFVSHPLEEL
ncbi:putative mitochondrial protein [Andalucia godoyi]|uniref:Putative mitochondrial protein n=1 Tax=Andalucia godoyi TaxID=505711 RepID=A0A8K0AIP8_ANDGO|nr:putative mitochondrial protein [Andalucia godoyi]|eukprot:ANDGO_03158.mRNA.1 putative mitochondrial protein